MSNASNALLAEAQEAARFLINLGTAAATDQAVSLGVAIHAVQAEGDAEPVTKRKYVRKAKPAPTVPLAGTQAAKLARPSPPEIGRNPITAP